MELQPSKILISTAGKKKLGFIRLHPDFLGNMFVGFNHNKMRLSNKNDGSWDFTGQNPDFLSTNYGKLTIQNVWWKCWKSQRDQTWNLTLRFFGGVGVSENYTPKELVKNRKNGGSDGFRSTHGTLCSDKPYAISVVPSMTNDSKLPLESSGYPKMDSGFGHGDRMGSCSHPIFFRWYLGRPPPLVWPTTMGNKQQQFEI